MRLPIWPFSLLFINVALFQIWDRDTLTHTCLKPLTPLVICWTGAGVPHLPLVLSRSSSLSVFASDRSSCSSSLPVKDLRPEKKNTKQFEQANCVEKSPSDSTCRSRSPQSPAKAAAQACCPVELIVKATVLRICNCLSPDAWMDESCCCSSSRTGLAENGTSGWWRAGPATSSFLMAEGLADG